MIAHWSQPKKREAVVDRRNRSSLIVVDRSPAGRRPTGTPTYIESDEEKGSFAAHFPSAEPGGSQGRRWGRLYLGWCSPCSPLGWVCVCVWRVYVCSSPLLSPVSLCVCSASVYTCCVFARVCMHDRACVCVCLCTCAVVRASACMRVFIVLCAYGRAYVRACLFCARVCVCVRSCVHLCVCVCAPLCLVWRCGQEEPLDFVYVHAFMHGCMHVCMYVRMYVGLVQASP